MYARLATHAILEALTDTRVVLVTGPRQAGKTTLVRTLPGASRPYFSFDDPAVYNLARADPTAFVRGLSCATLDEVQRVPEILLAIKRAVDDDPRPGRFLLTGSADVMTMPVVADSLAGRMETVRLLPLAQVELAGTHPTCLQRFFEHQLPALSKVHVGDALVQKVLQGGYPDAIARASPRRRAAWYEAYTESLLTRDVHDIADIERAGVLPQMLKALACTDAQLFNASQLGTALQMSHKTAAKYVNIFRQLYLVSLLPPWSNNRLTRAVKAPKLHFVDSGLLASVQGIDAQQLKTDRKHFGPLLETFVVSEVSKLAHALEDKIHLHHYRDRDGRHEVDLVLEGPAGRVVGIEVKAAASVTAKDFSGLTQLARAAGSKFALGVVLYDHDTIIPFGDRLFAVPISCLWH